MAGWLLRRRRRSINTCPVGYNYPDCAHVLDSLCFCGAPHPGYTRASTGQQLVQREREEEQAGDTAPMDWRITLSSWRSVVVLLRFSSMEQEDRSQLLSIRI